MGANVLVVGQRLAQFVGINSAIVINVKCIKHLPPLLLATSDKAGVRFVGVVQ